MCCQRGRQEARAPREMPYPLMPHGPNGIEAPLQVAVAPLPCCTNPTNLGHTPFAPVHDRACELAMLDEIPGWFRRSEHLELLCSRYRRITGRQGCAWPRSRTAPASDGLTEVFGVHGHGARLMTARRQPCIASLHHASTCDFVNACAAHNWISIRWISPENPLSSLHN